MSGFAKAGFGAFDSIKSKASQRFSGNNNAGYEEFEMPLNRGSMDNKGFEDDREFSFNGSQESLAEPERPPLRHIDTYCMPECPCLSKRYTLAVLACAGFIISFGMRCNMGMAKLMMRKNVTDNNKTTQMFNWTIATESALDSSFFWGYLVTQVPGGFLASLYPANRVFGIAIAASSFWNLLVPGALSIHPVLDMCVQVCKGLAEGVTYPACHGMWKYWAPPLERSRLATLAFCGSYAAVVIGMPLSGCLTDWFGWTASFYFYGICGLIWYCFWLWLAFEKPSKHPCISARELRYIEDSLGHAQAQLPMPTFFTTPWRKFFTSMPVYAIIVANFCRSWNFYLLVLFQGRFMHESFGMAIIQTGFIGSLPHLLMTTIVPCGGLLADHLRKRGILSTTNVRKIFNCGGFGMEGFFFLVVAYATTHGNTAAANAALTIGVACSGFAISGFNVNHLDIAPRYASILMGISNGIGTIAGLLVPFFVDNITQKRDHNSWRDVFITAACVHFFGVTFYAIFCSGELQPWADPTLEEQASWNPLDDLGKAKPPLPPPPKPPQPEFVKQPSLGGSAGDWNSYDSSEIPSHPPSNKLNPENNAVISYGAMETNANNPFNSTNPFASDVSATLVQPPSRDDYAHDVMQDQKWN